MGTLSSAPECVCRCLNRCLGQRGELYKLVSKSLIICIVSVYRTRSDLSRGCACRIILLPVLLVSGRPAPAQIIQPSKKSVLSSRFLKCVCVCGSPEETDGQSGLWWCTVASALVCFETCFSLMVIVQVVLHISFNGKEFLVGIACIASSHFKVHKCSRNHAPCHAPSFQVKVIRYSAPAFLFLLGLWRSDGRKSRFFSFFLMFSRAISALTSVRQTWILSRVSRIVCLLLYTYRAFRLAGGWAWGFRDNQSIMYVL